MNRPADPPDRLARRLGLGGAVVIGLGAMLGAGVFAAFGPAAEAAGSALLVGLAIAAVIAYLNANASARLAARHPESGGTYVYASRHLGRWWGVAAGWCFISGKLASCAAMALVFGAYLYPDEPRIPAVAAVVVCAAVNHRGITKTLAATIAVLVVVAVALAACVAGALGGGTADAERLSDPLAGAGAAGVLEAAGFLFFAFAGYARIATLGEEVREPRRTIPRAMPIALGIALAVYALVGASALAAAGPDALAASAQPLVTAVTAGDLDALEPLVRAGAVVACLGVLVSLLAGVARTAFAMAAAGDLPRPLGAVDAATRVPQRAGLAAAAIVVAVVAVADLRGAIGFSSVLVLVYYALANASAFTLPGGPAAVGRIAAVAGVAGCLVVAASLPPATVATGMLVLAGGLALLVARDALTRRRG